MSIYLSKTYWLQFSLAIESDLHLARTSPISSPIFLGRLSLPPLPRSSFLVCTLASGWLPSSTLCRRENAAPSPNRYVARKWLLQFYADLGRPTQPGV
jgi:hypothetical protein